MKNETFLKKNIVLISLLALILIGCKKENTNTDRTNPGVYDYSIYVDTLKRWFKVVVPEKYDHTEDRPLLFAFHGGDLTMGYMHANRPDIVNRCADENWILVFPNGATIDGERGTASWNGVHCCGRSFNQNVNESGFVKSMIDTLNSVLKIDNIRIYAIGGSNGGFLIHRLAAEIPHIFAAVAENQGTIGGTSDSLSTDTHRIQPTQPIPIIMIHGMNDGKVKFHGGLTNSTKRSGYDLSFKESVLHWATYNQCEIANVDTTIVMGEKDSNNVYIVDFPGCLPNTAVRGIAIDNMGHGWPGLEESGYDGTKASIDFLKQFPN